MGGIARRNRAATMGAIVKPRSNRSASGKARASTANDGIARPKLARVTVMNSPLRACPMYRPRGSATRTAASNATPDVSRCSRTLLGMPSLPAQLAPSVSHFHNCSRASTTRLGRSTRRPRREPVLDRHKKSIGYHSEEEGEEGADDHRGHVQPAQALQDVVTEAALPYECSHRNEPNGRDGRDPDPGQDHGQRQRYLHLPQHLWPG